MWFSVFTEDFICMCTDNLGGPTRNVSFILVSFWLWTNSHNKHSWDLHIYFLPKPIQARNSRVENNLTTHNNSFLSHQEIFNETLFFQFFAEGLFSSLIWRCMLHLQQCFIKKISVHFLLIVLMCCYVPTELHTFSIYSIFIYLYIFTITLAALLCCFFTTHNDELPSL